MRVSAYPSGGVSQYRTYSLRWFPDGSLLRGRENPAIVLPQAGANRRKKGTPPDAESLLLPLRDSLAQRAGGNVKDAFAKAFWSRSIAPVSPTERQMETSVTSM